MKSPIKDLRYKNYSTYELKNIIDYEKTIVPNIDEKTGLHLFIFDDNQVFFLENKNRQDLLKLLFKNE